MQIQWGGDSTGLPSSQQAPREVLSQGQPEAHKGRYPMSILTGGSNHVVLVLLAYQDQKARQYVGWSGSWKKASERPLREAVEVSPALPWRPRSLLFLLHFFPQQPCVHNGVPARVQVWRSDENLRASVLSFYHVSLRDLMYLLRLGSKCLHPPSHLVSPDPRTLKVPRP